MPIIKTSAKGQIVIPKAAREKLGIQPGSKVFLRVVEDHAEISPLPDDPIRIMKGMLKGGKSLSRELLAERKEDNITDEKYPV